MIIVKPIRFQIPTMITAVSAQEGLESQCGPSTPTRRNPTLTIPVKGSKRSCHTTAAATVAVKTGVKKTVR